MKIQILTMISLLCISGCSLILNDNLGNDIVLIHLGDEYHEVRYKNKKIISGHVLNYFHAENNDLVIFSIRFADEVCKSDLALDGLVDEITVLVSTSTAFEIMTVNDYLNLKKRSSFELDEVRKAESRLRDFLITHNEIIQPCLGGALPSAIE